MDGMGLLNRSADPDTNSGTHDVTFLGLNNVLLPIAYDGLSECHESSHQCSLLVCFDV
jgi:hypothetical protein